MKLKLTPAARLQFLSALAYIREDDPDAAMQFRRKAETALRRLTRYPRSGRSLPEFPDLPHREVALPPYWFFYRVEANALWVVAVWHGARIPSALGAIG